MALQDTPSTIWQIWMSRNFEAKDVALKRQLLQFLKILIYIKGVTRRNTFHNSTNSNLYILKVSLQKTPSTIQKNWIDTKGVS